MPNQFRVQTGEVSEQTERVDPVSSTGQAGESFSDAAVSPAVDGRRSQPVAAAQGGETLHHFFCLAQGIDVVPLLLALYRQPWLWDQYLYRTAAPGSPHAQGSDILIRCEKVQDAWPVRECVWYPAYSALPEVRPHIFGLMTRVGGERLGRVILSKLGPGKQITPHKDIGTDNSLYYDTEPYYQRYHTLLQSPPGAIFHCGGESLYMPTGTCWTFRNDLEHSVVNDGKTERISLIIDIRVSPVEGPW